MYADICQARTSVGTTNITRPLVVVYADKTDLPAEVGALTTVLVPLSILLMTSICQLSNFLNPC